jgi:K+ transporter
MEEPNVMRAVAMMRAGDFHHLHLAEISFFVGKEKVLAKKSSGFLTAAFIFMHRTMQSATEFYRIPFDHAIEIGGHVEI